MIEASRFKEKTDLPLKKASRNPGEAKFIPLGMRSYVKDKPASSGELKSHHH